MAAGIDTDLVEVGCRMGADVSGFACVPTRALWSDVTCQRTVARRVTASLRSRAGSSGATSGANVICD